MNIMALHREIYDMYDSKGLEKWRYRMWLRGVQAQDEKRWGTGLALETMAVNNSPIIS